MSKTPLLANDKVFLSTWAAFELDWHSMQSYDQLVQIVSGNYSACTHSHYQALFPHPREPGDKASSMQSLMHKNQV